MSDPDLTIRWGVSPPKVFRPFRPQFGPKIRGGGGRGPFPGSATATTLPGDITNKKKFALNFRALVLLLLTNFNTIFDHTHIDKVKTGEKLPMETWGLRDESS